MHQLPHELPRLFPPPQGAGPANGGTLGPTVSAVAPQAVNSCIFLLGGCCMVLHAAYIRFTTSGCMQFCQRGLERPPLPLGPSLVSSRSLSCCLGISPTFSACPQPALAPSRQLCEAGARSSSNVLARIAGVANRGIHCGLQSVLRPGVAEMGERSRRLSCRLLGGPSCGRCPSGMV